MWGWRRRGRVFLVSGSKFFDDKFEKRVNPRIFATPFGDSFRTLGE
jgi:hypothetical protein